MRVGLAVVVAVLLPGCVRVNPSFRDGQGTGEGSGDGTSMGTGGTAPTDSAPTLPTASASGATSSPPPTTTMSSGPDIGASGPSSDSEVTPEDWWDTDYAHRRLLVFHQREAALFDFVTYVPLSFDPSRLESVVESQLAFVGADTNTRINAEVVLLDPEAGELAAWVQLPEWKSGEPTEVFLYFGFTAPEARSASPWSRHIAVWHMDEFSGGGLTPDATGSAHATQVDGPGAAITVGPGIAGGALEFDGVSQRLEASLPGGLKDDAFLVSAWVNPNSYQADGSPIIARGDRSGGSWEDAEWVLGFTPDRAEGRVHDDMQNGTPTPNVGVALRPAGDWHHYALLYTGSNIQFYIDGAGFGGSTNPGMNHVLTDISIGGYTDPLAPGWESRLLDGRIDELRWRRGAGDDAANDVWVETLYESQLTPEATFTPADVEDL